jgi:hypothetical protein
LQLDAASDAELARLGLLSHRTASAKHPDIAALWKKAFQRKLRKIAPRVELKTGGSRPILKRRGGTGGAQATTPNWCGGVLSGGGNWSFVTSLLTLPYLSTPLQNLQGKKPASLSAWVGLDGYSPNDGELFQAVLAFALDETTDPPAALFSPPNFQWWIPDPKDSYAQNMFTGGNLTNAPPMKSGDLVQIAVEYLRATNGDNWGRVTFVFFDYLEEVPLGATGPGLVEPLMMDLLFLGPATTQASYKGATAEWILENESVTSPSGAISTTVPVFSAAQGSLTPLLFAQAWADTGVVGYNPVFEAPLGADIVNIVGPYGAPSDGFTVLWQVPGSPSQVSTAASVTLAPLEGVMNLRQA